MRDSGSAVLDEKDRRSKIDHDRPNFNARSRYIAM